MTVVSFLSSRVEGEKKKSVRRYYPRACTALQALLKLLTKFDSFGDESDKNVWTSQPPVPTHSGGDDVNRHSCRRSKRTISCAPTEITGVDPPRTA
jgi:hypothetical protein